MQTLMFALCSALALLLTTSSVGAQSTSEDVRTIAGSGKLGISDGPALSATFLVPTGLARGRDGTIYVSDEAAQRIRAIKDGIVSTVAGTGDLGLLHMSVPGGYQDGPALSARFNHPMGLAVDASGALFIADRMNKMIRKLDHGVVTTVVTGLVAPVDIAFDSSGNLWIADYKAGVKRWNGHTLTSVPLPDISNDVLAISFSPDTDLPKLIVVTTEGILEFDAKSAEAAGPAPFAGLAERIAIPSEGWTFGTPRQIVAFGKHQAVYSDPVYNDVRYVRFQVPPLASQPFTIPLAGGDDYKGINNAGFADGTAARFYAPRGILIYGNTIVVADAGNRRIRTLPLPDFRQPEYGLAGVAPYDNAHYEIALVGASNTFFDAHDNSDSICGAIESRLNASHHIAKPVRCHTIRIDAGQLPQDEDYINTYLTFRKVDLYIISVRLGWIDEKVISDMRQLMQKTKARVMLLAYPGNQMVSDSEDLVQRETDFVSFPDDFSASHAAVVTKVRAMLSGVTGLSYYDLLPDLVKYEKKQNALPLYLAGDSHMNGRGNAFVGDQIAHALLQSSPTLLPDR